jgi:hypothetical protein
MAHANLLFYMDKSKQSKEIVLLGRSGWANGSRSSRIVARAYESLRMNK